MANTHLTRTQVAGNRKKFTISAWVKRSKINYDYSMWFAAGVYNSSQMAQVYWASDNRLRFGAWESNGANHHYLTTERLYTDTNAWYHIVVAVDTSQSTEADRCKIYTNGVLETSFYNDGQTYYPNQNYDYPFNNNGSPQAIGTRPSYTGGYHEGYISHVHFCDGYQYTASDFGSFDSTTGEWKINTSPSVSYGTNGFLVLKDGTTITDQSSNSNDFTLGSGTLTKSEDNPSNTFTTFNPLVPKHSDMSLSNGNTTISSTNGQWLGSMTTTPLYGGKWYYECKYNTGHGIKLSIVGEQSDYRNFKSANNSYGEYHGNGYGYQFNNSGNDYLGNNNSTPNWGGGLSSNPGTRIYMVAINLENGKIWYGTDGTWFNDASGNTGNPSTDAYPHQTISATHLAQKPFLVTGSVEGNGATMNWNFGNGYFGTTAVSSAGNNASNLGVFEYDVPTGFTAICTKGLNE